VHPVNGYTPAEFHCGRATDEVTGPTIHDRYLRVRAEAQSLANRDVTPRGDKREWAARCV